MAASSEPTESHGPLAWDTFQRWAGRDLVREVWYFGSGGDRLYASAYASPRPRLSTGLVMCPSWGSEMAHLQDLCHDVARGLASAGGAGLVYHPPAHGDSTGDPDSLTLNRLVKAAVDAARDAGRRLPQHRWQLCGIRLGASVAMVAAEELSCELVLLIEPALDPAAYFDEIRRAGRRGALGHGTGEAVFGYPLPDSTVASATEVDVGGAVERFPGKVFAVRAARRDSPSMPASVETITVQRAWRPKPSARQRAPFVQAMLSRLVGRLEAAL